MKKKYIEIPKKDSAHEVENSWFTNCRVMKSPFITLKIRTKFADVHWDYITYDPAIDKIFRGLDGKLRDAAICIFNKYANSKSRYAANDHLVWFKNLEIEKARLAADELYDLIESYVDGH